MNKRTITILVFTILLISGFASAQDIRFPLNPPPGYYGSITVNGQPAAAGTTITAMIGGEVRGSITTAEPGIYGNNPGPAKLWIRSYQNEPGSTVTFYVSGIAAQQTTKLPNAGTTNRTDLTFTGVPVQLQAGASAGSSGSGSNSSSSGSVVNTTSTPGTTMTPGLNQPGIAPEVIGTPGKLSPALDASPLAALPTNPAVIIGVVILLASIIIAAPRFKKK